MVTTARPVLAGAGPSVGWRPGDRVRLVATALPAVRAGRLVGRGELRLDYLLTPARLSGAGVYGFAGIAGVTAPRRNGFLLLGAGVEGAPGAAHGWLLEGGVGGGLRLAAGFRWRWFAPARRR